MGSSKEEILLRGWRKGSWIVGVRIVWAWVLTIPASAAASYVAYRLLAPALERM
jgi:phosphate/sulfate permease